MEKSKTIRFYALLAGVLFLLILLNFFFSRFGIAVPLLTFLATLAIVYLFWRRDQALAMREYQFLTITTHNFRTPLAGMKWAVDALREDVASAQKETLLAQLESAIGRILTVVEVLVGVVKSDDRLSYAFEAVSFHDLIEASLKRFNEQIKKKELQLNIQVSQNIPLIVADVQKIQFVVDSLIENAINYSVTGAPVAVIAVPQGKEVLFSVTDLGLGLTRDDKRNIFKQYYRGVEAQKSNPNGLGLSLFIASIIVKHHKGKLWADSAGEKKGSTLYLKLQTAQQGK